MAQYHERENGSELVPAALREEARAGLPEAQFEIGRRLALCPERERDSALIMLRRAANTGMIAAAELLVTLLSGNSIDSAEASHWQAWLLQVGDPEQRLREAMEQEGKNPAAARRLLEQAARGGLAAAQFRLGRLIEPLDQRQACLWYRRAAFQGYPEAGEWLIRAGETVTRPPPFDPVIRRVSEVGWKVRDLPLPDLGRLTREQLVELAQHGVPEAETYLADDLWKGITDHAAPGEALYWFRRAASRGYLPAQLHLGLILESQAASHAPAELLEACDWYERAALRGDKIAAERLGTLLAEGRPPTLAADPVRARPMLMAAAEAGRSAAAYRLGQLCQQGLGGPPDPAAAARWFTQSAEGHYRPAEVALGLLYETGRGVRCDLARAAQLFEKANRYQGNSEAQFRLGQLYLDGRGVARDAGRGFALLERAARDAHLPAARLLGQLLLEGGPDWPADPIRGRSWSEWVAAREERQPDQ